MRRYGRVYRAFFLSAIARELEFRANFFAKVAQNLIWISFYLVSLFVVYRNTSSVAGWGQGQAILLSGTLFLLAGTFGALAGGLAQIPEQVRRGTLDFVVTKPIDAQFWVSFRYFDFAKIGGHVGGMVLVVVGLLQSKVSPGPVQWLAYLTLLGCAVVIYYSFFLCLMTLGIWLVRVDNLWVLGESVMDVARFPTTIYEPPVQRLLLYVLPLAFLAMVPTMQLTQGVDPAMVGTGLIWAVAAFGVSRTFWRFALRFYGSASS